MSATRHDVLTEFNGKLLKIDAPAPAPAAPDFTEDLADEITSELAPTPRLKRVVPVPIVDRTVADEGSTGPAAFATGENVLRERYVLETQLGNGGTAMVFRAVDLRRDATSADGRRVAIKLLRPELRDRPQNIARLQREFRQTQAVAHPNVVRVHDLDCDRGSWFIVMELLTGETLGPCLRRVSPQGLPQPEALRIAVAVGEALVHAHARGVAHGDVKPDNIFLTASGEVRLLDFGVAPESTVGAAPDDAPATPVAPAATRVYASLEVLSGADPEPRDDVFSLACVIYEMLAGSHPYGRSGADVAQQAGIVPEPIASLDSARRAVLAAALDMRRAARPSMAELVDSLRGGAAMIGPPATATAVTAPVARAPHSAKRSRILWLGAIAAGLALVIGILIGRVDQGSEPAAALPAPPPGSEPVLQDPAPAEKPVPQAAVEPRPAAPETATPAQATQIDPGIPPGLVSFDSSRMIVSKRAVVAAIPLRHLDRARRAVEVSWRVIDGTARAGRDFGGPLTGVETFVEGNTFRILYVPILTNAGAIRDRSFTVELTGTSPESTLGMVHRIEVTILGDA